MSCTIIIPTNIKSLYEFLSIQKSVDKIPDIVYPQGWGFWYHKYGILGIIFVILGKYKMIYVLQNYLPIYHILKLCNLE